MRLNAPWFTAGVFALVASLGTLQDLAQAAAVKSGHSFVITGSRASEYIHSRNKRHAPSSSMKSLRVTSVVMSRFARVTFVSEMGNNQDVAREIVFSVRLPEAAFITEFNMNVNDVTFVGKVKEKETAKQQYDKAVKSGNSAGLVVAKVRETQTFDVSANVPARSSVVFQLVYQQLLKRRLGQYDHVITVSPGQFVDDFVIDVYITETSGITSISTESPGKGSGIRDKVQKGTASAGRVEVNTDIRRSKNQAKVTFKPTPTELRRFLMIPEDEQKFTVRYDVNRDELGGEIQTRNGYFVHFFAPDNLPILPKNVVFVIDRSGSMQGRKIKQTKTAFKSIIKELRDSDKFNIVSFAGKVTAWKTVDSGLVDVTEENVVAAMNYVEDIDATGGTNLNGAALKATDLLNNASMGDDTSSMIILLTDGMPTSGVTNTAQIRQNIKEADSGRYSLFCLGFGNDLNHDFLKRLASENNGIARKIYEDSDADLQLKGFFLEVATPLLLNVKMTYEGVNLTDVSQSDFNKYFKGSEKVIVGSYKADEHSTGIMSIIRGTSREIDVKYNQESSQIEADFQHWYKDTGEFEDFIERLWAYYTIRNLLEKMTLSENRIEMQENSNRALTLALKYHFVTPLTAMVVTLPEDEVTTTAVGPTILPPIPKCYARGTIVPNFILRPPIWCPIILNPILLARSRSRQSILGPAASSSRPRRPSAPRQNRPSSTRITGLGSFQRQSMVMVARSRYRRPTNRPFSSTHATTTEIPQPRDCSGKLKNSSGTIQLPEDTTGSSPIILCIWQIKLGRGKWIDIFVESANTNRNEVIIKSRGKTIFEHRGGISDPKYILLENGNAEVQFTVYSHDDVRPGIVISYQEFVPHTTKRPASSPPTPKLSSSLANCGRNFSLLSNVSEIISSPRYPKMYQENAYCLWNIVNLDSEHRNLRLRLLDIDIEAAGNGDCDHDKLIIVHGENKCVLCGYKKKKNMVIAEEVAQIAFLTDGVLGAGGFKIAFDSIPM